MLSKSEKGRMSFSWSVVSCCGIMVKGLNSASFSWIPETQPRGCGNALLWVSGLFPLEKAILVQFAVVFTGGLCSGKGFDKSGWGNLP